MPHVVIKGDLGDYIDNTTNMQIRELILLTFLVVLPLNISLRKILTFQSLVKVFFRDKRILNDHCPG